MNVECTLPLRVVAAVQREEEDAAVSDHFRRFCSTVMRWANLRPPRGHMDMLRGEMTRRDDERSARDALAADKRRTAREAERPPDVSD
jgi:hypothetical protein